MKYASFNVHAWIKGCRGLSADDEGYYIRLCMAIYDNDGPVELNLDKLRLTLGCKSTKKAEKVINNLINTGLIYENNGFISNDKCDEVLLKAHSKSKILSIKAVEREKIKNAIINKKPLVSTKPEQVPATYLPPTCQLAATNENENEKVKDITTTVVCPNEDLSPPSGGDTNLFKSEFEKVWAAYPRKVKKQPALKAFIKARKKHDYNYICKPLREFIDATISEGEPSNMVHLATYLNEERFGPDENQQDAVTGRTNKGTYQNGRQEEISSLGNWSEHAASLDLTPPTDGT